MKILIIILIFLHSISLFPKSSNSKNLIKTSPRIIRMLKNCISDETKNTIFKSGPKNICYPGKEFYPSENILNENLKTLEKDQSFLGQFKIFIFKIASYQIKIFHEKLQKDGLRDYDMNLTWIDNLVFDDTVDKPTILINTSINNEGKHLGYSGIILVLPKPIFKDSSFFQNLKQSLRKINNFWNKYQLNKISPDLRNLLLQNPLKVYKIIECNNTISAKFYTSHLSLTKKGNAIKRKKDLTVTNEKTTSLEETYINLKKINKNHGGYTWVNFDSDADMLKDKGIYIDLYQIIINGRVITSSDLINPVIEDKSLRLIVEDEDHSRLIEEEKIDIYKYYCDYDDELKKTKCKEYLKLKEEIITKYQLLTIERNEWISSLAKSLGVTKSILQDAYVLQNEARRGLAQKHLEDYPLQEKYEYYAWGENGIEVNVIPDTDEPITGDNYRDFCKIRGPGYECTGDGKIIGFNEDDNIIRRYIYGF